MKEKQVSIGLPVFNGGKKFRDTLDSLLNQTFTDFELIISDNASTDETQEICKEYELKDNRIKYFRQEKNHGMMWNYNFVLQKATCDYFMSAASDDLWSEDFLQKNFEAVSSDSKLVCSMGQVKVLEEPNLKSEDLDQKFSNFKRKLIDSVRPWQVEPLMGTYEKKVRQLFKKSAYPIMYGIFRTEPLKKSMTLNQFMGTEVPFLLNVLKYGDVNIVDDVFMFKSEKGTTSKGMINLAKTLNTEPLGHIFPHYPLTKWCRQNLGWKIFLQNLDHFIKLNLGSMFFVCVDLFRLFVKKFS